MSHTLSPRRRWLAALGLAPLLQACSPIRLINATVPSNTHTVLRGEAYGSAERQRMDVYLPVDQAPDAPMAVFFYGGSWSSGERADYKFVGEALASRGIVTVIADYRLSPEVRYPVFLQDCALAVRWARDNARRLGASPSRLFVIGHSAGAYNAAMLALDARWLTEVNMEPGELAGWAVWPAPTTSCPSAFPRCSAPSTGPTRPANSQPLFHASAGHGSEAPRAAAGGQKRHAGEPATQHPGHGAGPAAARNTGGTGALRPGEPHHADRCHGPAAARPGARCWTVSAHFLQQRPT